MIAHIVRSAMSFPEFTIDIPAIPRNGDHISIYCECPWDESKKGTRDYAIKHLEGCPGTINWYVTSVGFHGNFPKGYVEGKNRGQVIQAKSITIGVDDRNPHVWPEIYGLPYDPNDKDLHKWRQKDLDEWEAKAQKLRDKEKTMK